MRYHCPLCHSSNGSILELISLADLSKLYRKSLGFNINYLFSTDTIHLVSCSNCKLQYYSPATSGDEKFYSRLQQEEWYYVTDKEEYNYAKEFINPGSKVLEIGSGKGAFAKKLSSVDYTGLEFSAEAIKIAEKQGIKLVNESIEQHALGNKNSYDVVCSFQVLEHVEDIHNFVKSSLAALKENGLMLISVPSENSFLSYSINDTLNLPPHHISRWKDDVFQKMADLFHLELVAVKHQPSEPIHYFQYFYATSHIAIRKLLGLPIKRVDLTFVSKLIKLPSFLISKLLLRVVNADTMPYGHTVTAVFRKR
jgi:SAM-dependent methyltransferase